MKLKAIRNQFVNEKLSMSVKSCAALIFGIFACSGLFGFIYEMIFYIINNGVLTRRGSNFGPWIQIYCIGGVVIFLVTYKLRKKPLLVFLVGGAVCTALEYLAGWAMEMSGTRLTWNYNTEIWNWGNVNGYICIRSALVFAAASLFLMYIVIPFLLFLREKMGDKAFCILMFVIGGICLADVLYNDVFTKISGTLDAITFYGESGWYPLVTGYSWWP